MKNQLKMLIIEDSEEILSALVEYYSEKNYTVTAASNGQDGHRLLETKKYGFDIVLTDLVLPYVHGVGLINLIKEKNPSLIVIAITGWGNHPEDLAAAAKADRVLRKPLKLDELDKILAELLTNR